MWLRGGSFMGSQSLAKPAFRDCVPSIEQGCQSLASSGAILTAEPFPKPTLRGRRPTPLKMWARAQRPLAVWCPRRAIVFWTPRRLAQSHCYTRLFLYNGHVVVLLAYTLYW